MNNLNDRINKVKSERKDMLENTKNLILDNMVSYRLHIKEIEKILDTDEKCVKKVESLTKIQDIIEKLSQEILTINDKEQVAKLRKKLNYYINKVKCELQNRNIDEKFIKEYTLKTEEYRKSVSKYLRYEKRNNKMLKIENYQNNLEQLNKDDLMELRKLLKSENDYNRKNVIVHDNPIISKSGSRKALSIDIKKKNNGDRRVGIDTLPNLKNKRNEEALKRSNLSSLNVSKNKNVSITFKDEKKISDIDEYILFKMGLYKKRYGIMETISYDGNMLIKINAFIKNIKIYRHNKKKVNYMLTELPYYKGNDFISFIEYIKENNSFKMGLRKLLGKSSIYLNNESSLLNHQKYVEWIKNYCRINNLQLDYSDLSKEKTL